MGKTFFDYVSNEGKSLLFGLPASEELAGRTARLPDGTEIRFADELAVKCDDDLFLAEAAGRLLLVEELADESLKALDAAAAAADATALPEELEGWETDLCLASGYVLTALFKDGALTLRPSPEPVMEYNPFTSGKKPAAETPEAEALTLALRAVKTGDKRFLLRFPETGETVFFSARRFLLYALLGGRIVTGFVEIPPKS